MAQITTVQDGAWSNASTWSGGTIPAGVDYAVIDHDVTVSADFSAAGITIRNGSLRVADNYNMLNTITATVGEFVLIRKLVDTRTVRLDGVLLSPFTIMSGISCYGTYAGDGFPTTYNLSAGSNTVIFDDPGVVSYTAQMQDIKPEGCARAYARKVGNGVRYMTITVHIKADATRYVGQLYRMAEGPFQVLAVTYSGVIKGYIESIVPDQASVGKEYRTFRVTVAEGQSS